MPCHVMGGDAAFKVVTALSPRLHKELGGTVEVAFAFALHTLDAQLDDWIARVHQHIISREAFAGNDW